MEYAATKQPQSVQIKEAADSLLTARKTIKKWQSLYSWLRTKRCFGKNGNGTHTKLSLISGLKHYLLSTALTIVKCQINLVKRATKGIRWPEGIQSLCSQLKGII